MQKQKNWDLNQSLRSALKTAYKPSLGEEMGGGMQLIECSKTGQSENKKIGKMIICIMH